MAKNHDLHEGIAFDFTPHDNIPKDDKKKLYYLAANMIFEGYPALHALWNEAEYGDTPRAKRVRDSDQLEMITFAMRIERQHPQMADALNPFWDSARVRVCTDAGKEALAELERERKKPGAYGLFRKMNEHYRR